MDLSHEELAGRMGSCSWWGVPTLFRCPHDPDPSHCDIALAGVPHNGGNGSTERAQHLGPRALREASMGYRRIHAAWRLDPWSACRITDVGDVPLPSAMHGEKSVQDIERFFRAVDAAGARPVSVGGDHAITLAILRALGGAGTRAGRPVAIVHFDAHLDSYQDLGTWMGATDSAGQWASMTVQEGHVDAALSVQLGGRGHEDPSDATEMSHRLGYRVIMKEEFDELGVAAAGAEIRACVGDAPVYVSFDLDVLDPSQAPAVCNPEPGYPAGMTMAEAVRMLRELRGLDVIGADVVCLMPTRQGAELTALNATAVMFEQVCLIADRLAPG